MLSRFTLIFGVLVGVTALGGAILRSDGDGLTEPGVTAPAGAIAVSVVGVIDGDTFEIEDAGGQQFTVRLFGIDTPERGEACYDEATARLRELAGSEVLLVADDRLQDPGGRELRYVYSSAGDSIDAALLEEGLAEAWTEDGALRDKLVAIEQEARDANRGCLWSGG